MDSLGSKQTCTTRSLHLLFIPFSRTKNLLIFRTFLFFANMLLHYHQFMNPNESDLNDVLMPASLSDDKIIKHMARRTLKLFVKMKRRQSYSRRPGENRLRSLSDHLIPATVKRQTSLNVIKP